MEQRRLFAADLVISAFASDGMDFQVTYNVDDETAVPFDISVYRSIDGVTLGASLQTVRVTDSAKLAVGSGHTISILPSFSDELSVYMLVVKLDSDGEISEPSEANNQATFSGGVFQSSDGVVHVQGTSSADVVSLSQPSTVDVVFNGNNFSFSASGVSGVHVRTHAGNDTISSSVSLSKSMWAFGGSGADTIAGGAAGDSIYGGDGNDSVQGGDGDDVLRGGDGDDILRGGDGADAMYGDAGADTVYGDAGNDTLNAGAGAGYGGYGDVLYGGDGNDTINGDGGNDVAYGGYGDDLLSGGYGDDVLYGEDGNDTLNGDGGNDSLYGGQGNDAAYGGYGDDLIDCGSGVDSVDAGEEAGDSVADRPVIVNFQAVEGALNVWSFSGTVVDDGSVTGRYVVLTGLISRSIPVQPDGTFFWTTEITSGSGYVYANFTDAESLIADQQSDYVAA
jgi:Ca2+-binding RTX toxin-like protein